MRKVAIAVVLAVCSASVGFQALAQQTIGLFAKDSGQQNGYVLFSPNSSKSTYLIDKCGKGVHVWNTKYLPGEDCYILPNGNLLATGSIYNPDFNLPGSGGGMLEILDWNGNVLWSYQLSTSTEMQNHDVHPMPNGDILACVWEKLTPAQAIAAGRDSLKLAGSNLYSAKVEELQPVGTNDVKIVWEWRLWDHLVQDHDSTKPSYGVIKDHPELLNINYVDSSQTSSIDTWDWIHANAVTYNADLDQVMISSRSLSEIWIIDHSTTTAEAAGHSGGKHKKGGDFLFRWGNVNAYNMGTTKDKTLFEQHDPEWVPDGFPGAGNISIFDDGGGRPGGVDYSSVDLIKPPVDTAGNYPLPSSGKFGPDSAYWSYTAPNPPDFFSGVQGGAQVLSNGNVLVCEAMKGNFFEVDSSKKTVWRYVCPIGSGPDVQGTLAPGNVCFRANLYPENYSGFVQHYLKPGAPLELKPISYSCTMPYLFKPLPMYNINSLKAYDPATGIADSANKGAGFIEGVVESKEFGSSYNEFVLIDSTGAITISSNLSYYIPSVGDSIVVGGKVVQTNGLTEYLADTIYTKPKGSWRKTPDPVSSLSEKTESDLVTLSGYKIVDTTAWTANTGKGFDVKISNGINVYDMYIDSNTDLFGKRQPNEEFNVTGFETQNVASNPYLIGYGIIPRSILDFERVTELYKIRDVRPQDPNTGIADSAGSRYNFFLKGILQSKNLAPVGLYFSLKDSTGDIVAVSNSPTINYMPLVGDSVLLHGLLIQADGMTEVLFDSAQRLNSALPLLVAGNTVQITESDEAHLVKLSGFYLARPAQWNPSGNQFDVDITNGADTFKMRVSAATDLYYSKAITGRFNVTGIAFQDKPSAPYFGNYGIEPRGWADIQKYLPLYKIKEVRPQNGVTGIADSINGINPFLLKGVVQSPNLTSNGLFFSLMDSTGYIIVAAAKAVNGYAPKMGDSVMVGGLLRQNNGLTEVLPDSVSLIGVSNAVMAPLPIEVFSEVAEANTISLHAYYATDASEWVQKGDWFDIHITNGTDTAIARISSATDLFGKTGLSMEFNISGIEIQDQPDSPYFGHYLIEPRGSFDVKQFTPLYQISQIRMQSPLTGVADSAGSKNRFFIKGIVQSADFTSSGGLEFSLTDNTGAIIVASATSIDGYVPRIGDSVEIRGLLEQLYGLTEVVPDSIALLNNATSQLVSSTATMLTETDEAQLVKLMGYRLIDTTLKTPDGSGYDVNITNGLDTTAMFITSTSVLASLSLVNEVFNVTGIEIQDKTITPYFGSYKIVPRSVSDFQRVVQLYSVSQVRYQGVFSGISDSAGSKYNFFLKGEVQSPDMASKGLLFSMRDSTGTIMVLSSKTVDNYQPQIGDSIELRGLMAQQNGLSEVATDSVSLLNRTGQTISPVSVSAMTESDEAGLIKLAGYQVINPSAWVAKGNGFVVNIGNGIDTVALYIISGTDLFKMKALVGPFNVTGIELQNQPISPYFGDYEIAPRGLFDIERYTQLYKIRQVRGQNPVTGISDSAGSKYSFYLKGIVQSPDFATSGYEFSMEDSTGSIIAVAAASLGNYSPSIGDSVEIRGLLVQVNGLIEVSIDSVSKLSPGLTTPLPQIVAGLAENTEAELVKYNNARLLDPSQWTGTGAGFAVDVTNGKDTAALYISSATDAYGMAVPLGRFNVAGIGFQDKPGIPYIGGYQLWPRSIADFQFEPYPLYKIGQVKGYDPVTGIADSINTYCYLKGVVQSGNISGNAKEFYTIQDTTGAISLVSSSVISGYQPAIGDSIKTLGMVVQTNGLTCFKVDSISKIAAANPLPSVLVTGLAENNESRLLNIKDLVLANPVQWDTTGARGSFSVLAYSATDTVAIQIVSGTDLYQNSARPKDSFDVTGIESQNMPSEPYFGGYYLIPRSISDFNVHQSSAIVPSATTPLGIALYPNPTTGQVNVRCIMAITMIEVTDMVGKKVTSALPNTCNTVIDLSGQKPGIYLMKVYSGNNMAVTRLVKN